MDSHDQARGHRGPRLRKHVDDVDRAKRRRRRDAEVSVEATAADPLDFGSQLFSSLPEWKITEEDIKMIRGRGLVPDKLRLDHT